MHFMSHGISTGHMADSLGAKLEATSTANTSSQCVPVLYENDIILPFGEYARAAFIFATSAKNGQKTFQPLEGEHGKVLSYDQILSLGKELIPQRKFSLINNVASTLNIVLNEGADSQSVRAMENVVAEKIKLAANLHTSADAINFDKDGAFTEPIVPYAPFRLSRPLMRALTALELLKERVAPLALQSRSARNL